MSNSLKNREPDFQWALTADERTIAAELQQRLPMKVFDTHMHLLNREHFKAGTLSATLEAGPDDQNLSVWRENLEAQVGEKKLIGGVVTPLPSMHADIDTLNRYALDQVEGQDSCFVNILVSPTCSKSKVEALLKSNRVVGFKPYHIFASTKSPGSSTGECEVGEYLPEWVWELADQHRLNILLHLVKAKALADQGNQTYIRDHCERFPHARLILAHAARGFCANHTVEGVRSLEGLKNVWFDTSAICEAEALRAILMSFGPRRLLWGSDFPVTQERGRCVSMGTGFFWINAEQPGLNSEGRFGKSIMVGLESLRAVFNAGDTLGLNAEDWQDIFCDNARRLLGLLVETENQTQALYREAKKLIPGGTQLLSKRPEMFAPDQWPAYFREARGCEVWDIDGKHYYDVSSHGIGACLLGYRDEDVTRAVQRRVALGSFSILNPPDEVEVAKAMIELHPWAEQARFARTGGEMMSVAVRIARATTDRSKIAICGYHGWHDWYLAANLGEDDSLNGMLLPGLDPKGVPTELRGTTLTFMQDDLEGFKALIKKHGDSLAAVVMEPCRYQDPDPGFLELIREETAKHGITLIFDEITIGWRLSLGGVHKRLGITPDLAVFAKSLGNGHPMAAVIGTRAAMAGAQESFISSTYWTEGVGPAAALAVLEKMKRIDLPAHCAHIGGRAQEAWGTLGRKHKLPIEVPQSYPALAHFAFKHEQGQALKTLYTQEMLKLGFLANTIMYPTYAHTDTVMDRYCEAIDQVFALLANILKNDRVCESLNGPVAHSGFKRLMKD
ncbi:MAG: aminotransferase class III-fold pyridoxal phosphate-dependent enzyme [Planctomycetota bacterium]|jgi:glutamate-1-semialdehyde 2,1-aminomutase